MNQSTGEEKRLCDDNKIQLWIHPASPTLMATSHHNPKMSSIALVFFCFFFFCVVAWIRVTCLSNLGPVGACVRLSCVAIDCVTGVVGRGVTVLSTLSPISGASVMTEGADVMASLAGETWNLMTSDPRTSSR